MRRKVLVSMLTLVLVALCTVTANAGSKVEVPKYDIVSAGVGAQGTYLCKVSVYSKKGNTKDADFKRAAVHGVIFKGVAGGNGVATQKAMTSPSTEYEKADFFKEFFADDGPYTAYANVVPNSISRAKTASKEICVSAVVVVSKDELRKYLEKAGVVRGLGSMF